MKKNVTFLFKLFFIAGLFTLIFKPELLGFEKTLFGDIDVIDVLTRLRDVSSSGIGWFVFCIACATAVKFVGIFSGVMRWKLLLRGQGLSMPFWYMTYQWFMGRAIGLLLPGTLGLDGYRLIESTRYTKDAVKCTTVIAIEKLIGIIALSFLVFMTFPLGFKYFNVNPLILAAIMLVLFGGVVTSFLLLLNPRVIQVLAAVLPVPGKIREIVNRLGAAVTAYSGSRATLLLAVFFGLLVHLGMCFMYFFTFLAIRAENTSIADIFFVSPLLITASVIAFTISGLGVREVAFGLVLGGAAGHATAVLGGHLGLWSGEIIPFLMSMPLLLFGGRPNRENIDEEMARIREETEDAIDTSLHLPPDVIQDYRRKVFTVLICGILGGLVAGGFIGWGESLWLQSTLSGLNEIGMFFWGPAVYGVLFAGAGFGMACGLLFLFLLFNRFAPRACTWALCFGGSLAAGGIIIGLFRLKRDVFAGHGLSLTYTGGYVLAMLAIGFVVFLVSWALARAKEKFLRENDLLLIFAGVSGWIVLVLLGAVYAAAARPPEKAIDFSPPKAAQGPDVILIGLDALRADYMRLFVPEGEAETRHLEALAEDAVVFDQAFSQASWTKPAFATIFTGLYPGSHTANSKTAALPEDITTLAEMLADAGYYTKGFSNNPNVTSIFNFHQGFTDYTDLKPDLLFGATASASKLSLYEVLRKGRQILLSQFEKRTGIGGMVITDFYQPADVITETALDWIDSGAAPEGTPYYLYLHYMDPHDPFMNHDNPGEGYARARNADPDPDTFLAPMRHAYITEIEFMDRHLGALFEGLKKRGRYDNTMIVLIGDHGEEFHDHGGWWHGYTLYDEMMHVPMIIKFPGNAQGGARNSDLARQTDIAPTILHMAGLEKDPAMPGQPLYDRSGIFTNNTIGYAWAENDFEGNVLEAVRSKTMKRIHANEDNVSGLAPVEIYDLTKDDGETENLSESPAYATAADELKNAIGQYRKVIEENAAEPSGNVNVSPEMNEQLEALGYM
jgi:arylsulfatase A-like enzyme